MAMGDLSHLGLFSLRISFPETVCPIVRPEFVQLIKTPFMYTVVKPDRSHGTTFQKSFRCQSCQSHDSLRVVPNTFYGEGIPNLSGSFPWALY